MNKQGFKILKSFTKIILFVLCLMDNNNVFAQTLEEELVYQEINDCPYIFYKGDSVEVKWIVRGKLNMETFSNTNFKKLEVKTCEEFKSKYVEIKPSIIIDDDQKFHCVPKIAILSDIHGQHDLFINLMKANKIINKKGEWSYGNGHFVIVGDIFDRGDKVTESLWFVYNLEKQAKKAGGKVHFLLGNHEVMILQGNDKYIHNKYKWVSEQMGVTYKELFGKETLLGEWIRTKPVAIAINDIAFVHAGFSPEFTQKKYDISNVNQLFHHSIIDHDKETVLKNDDLKFMLKKKGPIWYRGYFRDKDFTKEKAQKILHGIGMKHIVVGHTSMKRVLSHFDGLIYSVDSNLKKGEYGEILIWENNKFYRGTLDGKRIEI
ncbi:metallophosphoesterase [Aquimarina sp. BL5]|uniref:metallophosphoesterase n=2 Tax=Aquimarina sp. BL5 TaxID=1714860 RepID=UPI000E53B0FD|nr:metallophosphoesterase [Aquimarina sp. BL5]AXT53272.1 metallophosphoesterase [Aquimarina sp. BL5]RKN03200.1 metallophosphoesterase [Aquimarina sp. BL5]